MQTRDFGSARMPDDRRKALLYANFIEAVKHDQHITVQHLHFGRILAKTAGRILQIGGDIGREGLRMRTALCSRRVGNVHRSRHQFISPEGPVRHLLQQDKNAQECYAEIQGS